MQKAQLDYRTAVNEGLSGEALSARVAELREKINSLVRELGTQARGMEFKLEQNTVRYAEIGSFANGDSCKRCGRAADIVCNLADVAEVFAEQKKTG